MNKLKLLSLAIVYLAAVIISIPFVILLSVAALVIYGAFKLERVMVMGIDNDELTSAWNEMAEAGKGAFEALGTFFRTGIEL